MAEPRFENHAPIKASSSGTVVAHIERYTHPDLSPGRIRPLVWCDVAPGQQAHFRSFTRHLDPDEMVPDLPVKVLTSFPQAAMVKAGSRSTSYPGLSQRVRAFTVLLPSSLVDTSEMGAAVVLATDESTLAGMIFDARMRPDGLTELICYPGHLIATG